MFYKTISPNYSEEELEWMRLSPEKRFLESFKLWNIYLSLGGKLDPEPDPQSPFNFLYYPEKKKKRYSIKRGKCRRNKD